MQTAVERHPTPSMLLLPTDPPAVTVRNPDGQGPGIIVCDHASNAVPSALQALGLPTAAFDKHIAYDIGAKGIAEVVSDRLDMPATFGGYSRLVIDLNRPEDDFTSVREIYDGAIIPGNRRLSAGDIRMRTDELLAPYHRAIADALAGKSTSLPHPAVIAVHTCTDVYRGQTRPWHIGVLSNRDRRLADRVLSRMAALRPDLTLGDNKPYSGLDAYGYTIEAHALPAGLPNVLFEVRQDLVITPEGQREFGEILATVLKDVLSDHSLFTPFRG